MNLKFISVLKNRESTLCGLILSIITIFITSNPSFASSLKDNKNLTLEKALLLTLKNSLELNNYPIDLRISDAKILQAEERTNPELSSFLENIGGAPEVTGGSQLTMEIRQTLEWADKRTSRIKLANTEKDLIRLKYEVKKSEVFSMVLLTFTNALIEQEQLKLSEEKYKLADEVFRAVSEKVDAGKVSPFEKKRVNITFTNAKIEVENTKKNLEISKKKLALLLGVDSYTFNQLSGNFYKLTDLISLEKLIDKTSENPELALLNSEVLQRMALIEVEKIKLKPDLTVTGGYRVFDITKRDNISFVTGLSIPLPFFNTNQGAIEEAIILLEKLNSEKKILQNKLKISLIEPYKRLANSFNEINVLKTSVIPDAQIVFDAILENYRIGKFNYLEVLEAQQTLFQSKTHYINALENYHKSVVEIESIIGKKVLSNY